MTALELRRLKVQLKNVDAAKEEMEYRIAEREEEIRRLRDNIVIQDKRIEELKQQIAEASVAPQA